MNQNRKARAIGQTLILCAILFRGACSGNAVPLISRLIHPTQAVIHTEQETGQPARSSFVFTFLPESAPPDIPLPSGEPVPVFSESDLDSISLYYACSVKADPASLLVQPTELSLHGEEPTVLILHTHATESYTKNGEDYTESGDYRTTDDRYNMLSLGDRVASLLEEGGIPVLHDRELHDYPDYNSAYIHARSAIQQALQEHPSIRLILDLHRDAAGSGKNQLRTSVKIGDSEAAQLMLVMGTGNAGRLNDNWQNNLSLGLKLSVILERNCPGITRPITLRSQRFNQDLGANALLVEIGAAGNTHEEALLAAEELARAILLLG